MGIMVSGGGGTFTPAPAGTHQAVCVDVVDLGKVETKFGVKQMIRIVWQLNEQMADGRPFIVQSRYNATLNEKAILRRDLEAWRGRPFSLDELAGFDVEALIGANCLLSVVHKTSEQGKVFANVSSIMPLAKGMQKMEPVGYVRQKDREEPVSRGSVGPAPESVPMDDQIPF